MWIHHDHFHLLELLSLSSADIFLEQCKYGWEALLANWYLCTEILFGQAIYMVGCTIYECRDIYSHNICNIILWVMAGISLRPVRNILPIIPYLDNFLSSPRLGLISLNHSFGKSIKFSSVSLWRKQYCTISPCGVGIFFNKPFMVGILLRLLGPIFPHLANFLIFTNLSYF